MPLIKRTPKSKTKATLARAAASLEGAASRATRSLGGASKTSRKRASAVRKAAASKSTKAAVGAAKTSRKAATGAGKRMADSIAAADVVVQGALGSLRKRSVRRRIKKTQKAASQLAREAQRLLGSKPKRRGILRSR